MSPVSEEGRAFLKNAVHSAFLARYKFGENASSIELTVTALSTALQEVQVLWQRGASSDLGEAWRRVLVAAARLRDDLDSLPRGIVFP